MGQRSGFSCQDIRQEACDVITAVTEGHLRKVVCTEAEVFGFPCDAVGGKRGARYLNHRANAEWHFYAFLSKQFFGDIAYDFFLCVKLVYDTDKRAP